MPGAASSPAGECMPDTGPRVYIGDTAGTYIVEAADGSLHAVPDRWRGWRHRRPYQGPREGLRPVPDRPALAIAVRLGALTRDAPIAASSPEPSGPAVGVNGAVHAEPPGAPPAASVAGPISGTALAAQLLAAVEALNAALAAQQTRTDELDGRVARLEALRAADTEALRQVAALDAEVETLRRQLGAAAQGLTLSLGEMELEVRALRQRRRARRTPRMGAP